MDKKPTETIKPSNFFPNVIAKTFQDVKRVSGFLDDIIVYSVTLAEHKEIILELTKKLKEKNITINNERSLWPKMKSNTLALLFQIKVMLQVNREWKI